MIIFRYMVRELSGTFFAVTIVLLMIILSGRLIRTIANAAAGEASVATVLLAVALRIPYFLEIIIPLALFLSILIGYGRLYADSEMTVLTATGVSDRKMLGLTMIPAAFMMVFVAITTLYLSPAGAQKTEDIYQEEAKKSGFELLAPGRFQSMGKGSLITYTETLSADKSEMQNVFMADGNTVTLAERGTQYVSAETGSRYLELHEGVRYDLKPGTSELEVLEFERYGARLSEESADRRRLRREAIPTSDLLTSNDPKYIAQLHWRLSLIAMVPIVTLIAFPLAKVGPRQGRFAKMFPALMLFMVYISAIAGITGMVEKSKISPLVGIWGTHLVFLGIGLLLFLWPTIKRYRYIRRIQA